jgi:hypothetical protein
MFKTFESRRLKTDSHAHENELVCWHHFPLPITGTLKLAPSPLSSFHHYPPFSFSKKRVIPIRLEFRADTFPSSNSRMSEMIILAQHSNPECDSNTEISIYTTDISPKGSINGVDDGDRSGDGDTSQTLGFDTTNHNHNHNHNDISHLPNHAIPADLLVRLTMLEGNQQALKDEIGELKTLLEESKESERILERRIEEMVWAFNTE